MPSNLPKKQERQDLVDLPRPADLQEHIFVLLTQALDKGVSAETLERLLVMQREIKADWAKQRFDEAMAAFQGACPIIVKKTPGARTTSGQVVSYYAKMDDIVKQVKGPLSENGFIYSIDTEHDKEGVHAWLVLEHIDGHRKEPKPHVWIPYVDRTGVMTNAQVEMATMSIAIRRVFTQGLGIFTADDDRDGQRVQPLLAEEHVQEIEELFTVAEAISIGKTQEVLALYKVKEIHDLTPQKAAHLKDWLEKFIKKHQQQPHGAEHPQQEEE